MKKPRLTPAERAEMARVQQENRRTIILLSVIVAAGYLVWAVWPALPF